MRRGKRSFSRRMVTVGIVALSTSFLAGCSITELFSSEQVSSAKPQSAKMVKTAKVERQKIGEPVEQAAEVQSSTQINVVTKVDGDVLELLKKRGDVVQEGEVILRLHSAELKLKRERAVLALQSAQEAKAKAEKEQDKVKKDFENKKREQNNQILKMEQTVDDLTKKYNKLRNDYDYGLAVKSQVEQAQTQLKNTQMDLDMLRQQLKTMAAAEAAPFSDTALKGAELSLQEADQAMELLEIKAPISGVLTELPVVAGMTLESGAKAALIEKLDRVQIKANLSADAVKFVRSKKELTFSLPDASQQFKGQISYLSNVIDQQTKAYELNLEVPNTDFNLKPGMKVRVKLTDESEQNVIAIPTQSVLKEGEDSYVFVLNGDTAVKRRVELGRINEPIQEVLSGVKENELLVISGQSQLKNNDKVEVSSADAKK